MRFRTIIRHIGPISQFRLAALWVAVLLIVAQKLAAEKSVDALIIDLQNSGAIAQKSAETLAHMGGDALPAFRSLVQVVAAPHKRIDVRQAAVWALGRIAEQAGGRLEYGDIRSATPYVIEGVRSDERLAFRQVCAYTLGRFAGPISRESSRAAPDPLETDAINAILEALSDTTLEDSVVRAEFGRTLAEALGRLHPSSASAVNTISHHLIEIGNRLQTANVAPALTNKLDEFRTALTGALGQMGTAAEPAIPGLVAMLQSKDSRAQQAAAYALRNIGPAAQRAAQELINVLQKSGDTAVKQVAAFTLGRIRPSGAPGEQAVSALKAALGDYDPNVREEAARALGEFGTDAQSALTELTATLLDPDLYVRFTAAESLGRIAAKLGQSPKGIRDKSLPLLRTAQSELAKVKPSSDEQSSEALKDAQEQVRVAIEHIHGPFFERHPVISSIALFYLLLFVFIRFVVLTFWPSRLLAWNDNLDQLGAELGLGEGVPLSPKLTAFLGPAKIPLRYASLIGFFRYNSKVLDAWVGENGAAALDNLKRRSTVRARETFVPLPVQLDDGDSSGGYKHLSHLTPEALHSNCRSHRWCIRIIGEGGLGKTTLACQLASWAVSEREQSRLCPERRAIPILIEPGRVWQSGKNPSFRKLIRNELNAIIGKLNAPSEKVFDRLLQSRRVVVILDGASEMAAAAAAAGKTFTIDSNFPACALIVTSRTTDPFAAGVYTDVLPSRIDGDHLSPFMNAYLREAHLMLEDANVFEACKRLSVMVQKRGGVTPLLAELYAKAVVKAWRNQASLRGLPSSIPELIMQYVDDLNASGPAQVDTLKLHRVAKRAAWESVRIMLRPGPASKQALIEEGTADQSTAQILNSIEKQMQIIEPLPDFRFQFALDPLAEYLAALYIVEQNGSDTQQWKEFLANADAIQGAPLETLDFLTALADCIRWKVDLKVSAEVLDAIEFRVDQARHQTPTTNMQHQEHGSGVHGIVPSPTLRPEQAKSAGVSAGGR
jgi:HEAT repeat protein